MSRDIECQRGVDLCLTGCPIVDRLEQLKESAGMQSNSVPPDRVERVREDSISFGCPEGAFVEAMNIVFDPNISS